MSPAAPQPRGVTRGLLLVLRVLGTLGACAGVAAQDFPPEPAAISRHPSSHDDGPRSPDFGNVQGDAVPGPGVETDGDARVHRAPVRRAQAPHVRPAQSARVDSGPPSTRSAVPARLGGNPSDPAAVDAAQLMTTDGGGVPRLDARIAIARSRKKMDQLPMQILGAIVAPNQRAELRWEVGQSFDGGSSFTPVIVIHGRRAGPTLCLTAAIHGDELNGIEVVRRIMNETKPKEVRGTVIGVPIVNLFGFARGTRYLPDRRDLNRYFPGSRGGSSGSRIARRFFDQVVRHCDALVDFHTGSFARSNLPQVRADLTAPGVVSFTRGFGVIPVLHSPGTRGMLRFAASELGIAAVTFEVGAPGLLEPDAIDDAVESLHTLMHRLGMTRSYRMWSEPQAVLYASKWVRAGAGGMLFSAVELGDRVREGQRLGKVVDPVNNRETEIDSPLSGRVIGIAHNQLVLPGFAAYHVGVERSESIAVAEAARMPRETEAVESMEGDQLNQSDESPPSADRAESDAER